MSTRLTGKALVVTGATSGIGAALARLALERGAEVIGLVRRPEAVPDGVIPVRVDLTRRDEVAAAFQDLRRIDALVNCAGVAYQSHLIDGNPTDWEEMWRVNVMALALCSQLVLHHFPKSGGRIINVSSMSGHRVPPNGGFYSATKFAVRAITEALRIELRAAQLPVQVGSISPGFVDTPLLDNYFRGREEALEQARSQIRMLKPSELAAAIIFMLETPPHIEIGDIQIRSADQLS